MSASMVSRGFVSWLVTYDAKGNLTDINTPLASQNNIHLTVNSSNGTIATIRDANGTGTTSFG